MSEQEFKVCPFCIGHECSEALQIETIGSTEDLAYRISCTCCGFAMPYHPKIERAHMLWNDMSDLFAKLHDINDLSVLWT
jgi:hypothetical protein